MNNRGQTLALFIILIPVLLLFAAFVIDSGVMVRENTKLNSVTKLIIDETIDEINDPKINDKIKNLYIRNGIPTNKVIIKIKDNKLTISNEYVKTSMFGYIIDNYEYKVKIKLTGYKENDKIIIEKG